VYTSGLARVKYHSAMNVWEQY